jgi:hypothetical protein
VGRPLTRSAAPSSLRKADEVGEKLLWESRHDRHRRQLFHADLLITEQVERIEALEAEVTRLQAALDVVSGAAA